MSANRSAALDWQPSATLAAAQCRARMLRRARDFFAAHDVLESVQEQPYTGRVNRVADHVHQPVSVLWRTKSNRHVEYLFGELHRPFHLGAAPGDNDSGGN